MREFKKIVNDLITLRVNNKLNVEELAKKANVSGSYIYSLERGEYKDIKLITLDKLCKALGTTIIDIIKE